VIVLFDFDSTLIDCESLDEILADLLVERPAEAARVRAITDEGMEGRISYCDSLRRRLAIAQPTRGQVEAFGERAVRHATPGMKELIERLDGESWIVSGGLTEALLPVARHLGIKPQRVLGTDLRWAPDGSLAGIVCLEKPERVARAAGNWGRPRVSVGDGMSDYALYENGIVDHFLAFTLHQRRAAVVATGCEEVRTVAELEYALRRYP